MLETEKQLSKLYQAIKIEKGYNLELLKSEAEKYCNKYNKDLRIYTLGLKLAENQKNSDIYLNNFFNYFLKIEDYSNIWSKFTIELLDNKDFGIINYCEGFSDVEKSIQDIINLLEQYGDKITESAAWSAVESVRSAAWSARSAARSAAWSAVESVRSAARSAAWSAVESAAWSAESAAWSARSAARSAAESTAWSAESTAYKKMGQCLLDILKERNEK